MGKQKQYTREEFDDDQLDLLESGAIVAVLSGLHVHFVSPDKIQPYHHVISVQEAAKRLNLKHLPKQRGLLARIWDNIKVK